MLTQLKLCMQLAKSFVASETSGSVRPDPYLFLYLFVRNIGYADADCLGEQRSPNKFSVTSGLKDQSCAVLPCFKFLADHPSKVLWACWSPVQSQVLSCTHSDGIALAQVQGPAASLCALCPQREKKKRRPILTNKSLEILSSPLSCTLCTEHSYFFNKMLHTL